LLPANYAIGYSIGAGVIVAKGIKDYVKRSKEKPMTKQLTGVMTAAIFLISLLPIPVPITGTSSHPGGTPLAAILLGPWLTTVMSMVAMLLQALFFSHGGLTTLGANTLTMGVWGGLVGWSIFWGARKMGMGLSLAAALAGLIGDVVIYVGASIQLALAIHGTYPIGQVFWAIFGAFLPTQAPLAILEGIFTGMVIKFIADRRPDILVLLKVIRPDEVPASREVAHYE
jgi:cobalt/nickel transport system permease protein